MPTIIGMSSYRILIFGLLFFVGADFTRACNIPVFRYALERWDPSPYELLVYHRGPLDAEMKTLLQRIAEHRPPANIVVTTVDLAGEVEESHRKLWETHGKDAKLPWLLVRFPDSRLPSVTAESGPLTQEMIRTLLDSPARRTVADRLARGDSAVFLLLESGNPKDDEAVAGLLTKELPALEKTLELPETTPNDPTLRSSLPVVVKFTVLRLSRSDPHEALFVRQLLQCQKGLDQEQGPIVLPIFGRGRALGGLVDENLTSEGISQAASFLCGPCSCEVKLQNPGMDILLSADWDAILDASEPNVIASAPATPAEPETGLRCDRNSLVHDADAELARPGRHFGRRSRRCHGHSCGTFATGRCLNDWLSRRVEEILPAGRLEHVLLDPMQSLQVGDGCQLSGHGLVTVHDLSVNSVRSLACHFFHHCRNFVRDSGSRRS